MLEYDIMMLTQKLNDIYYDTKMSCDEKWVAETRIIYERNEKYERCLKLPAPRQQDYYDFWTMIPAEWRLKLANGCRTCAEFSYDPHCSCHKQEE